MKNSDHPIIASLNTLIEQSPKVIDEMIDDAAQQMGKNRDEILGHDPAMVRDLAVHGVQEAIRTMLSHTNGDQHACCDGLTCSAIALRALDTLVNSLVQVMQEVHSDPAEAIRKAVQEAGLEGTVEVMTMDELLAEKKGKLN